MADHSGSIKQARKGLRPGTGGSKTTVTGPQKGSASGTKPMTAGEARPASTWFK